MSWIILSLIELERMSHGKTFDKCTTLSYNYSMKKTMIKTFEAMKKIYLDMLLNAEGETKITIQSNIDEIDDKIKELEKED